MRFCALVVALVALLGAGSDDTGLSLADLASYRAALVRPAEGPARAVTFRELWDHGADFQGRRVRIDGKVARRFRQGAIGTFPPLEEVWATSPAGDPFCLVFPAGKSPSEAAPGASVRFEGTYLKRLRYHGADVDRLAPLIVGDRAPLVTITAPRETSGSGGWAGMGRGEWTIGLVVAALAAWMLAHRHLSGPPKRVRRETDPPPEFVDGA
jgi:hypothetical protein